MSPLGHFSIGDGHPGPRFHKSPLDAICIEVVGSISVSIKRHVETLVTSTTVTSLLQHPPLSSGTQLGSVRRKTAVIPHRSQNLPPAKQNIRDEGVPPPAADASIDDELRRVSSMLCSIRQGFCDLSRITPRAQAQTAEQPAAVADCSGSSNDVSVPGVSGPTGGAFRALSALTVRILASRCRDETLRQGP